MDGRFTIATDEPHVKVAWRVTALRSRGDTQSDHTRKEEASPRTDPAGVARAFCAQRWWRSS